MDNRYNISQLFKLAFGTNLPVYLTVPIGKEPAHTAEYGSVRTVGREEAMRLSKLGTPIVFPMKFTAGSYKFYDYQSKIVEKQLSDFWLPPATMVDFSRVKNISRTDVIGGNGTVKEIYGFDDWQIRIRTVCHNDELSSREYEKRLIEWSEVIQSISVEGDLFGWKNIHNLVIESIDIRSLEGTPNIIPIELNCISDEPFELIYRL
ncbi:DUF6046 domain-containing protein [Capnocytophaga granulosa]|uniref:DUF6046 domain-containing protein n=1 Tax=Capnocytophaga granulosa TaxID=45242 RepID=UPI0023F48C6E|nr:DUF6046 domain-containing protein [Capnocytophaga granulosa]